MMPTKSARACWLALENGLDCGRRTFEIDSTDDGWHKEFAPRREVMLFLALFIAIGSLLIFVFEIDERPRQRLMAVLCALAVVSIVALLWFLLKL